MAVSIVSEETLASVGREPCTLAVCWCKTAEGKPNPAGRPRDNMDVMRHRRAWTRQQKAHYNRVYAAHVQNRPLARDQWG